MARKKGERTEVFSVFGQIETVAAEIMIKNGEAVRIPPEQIPLSAAFNDLGQTAKFAVLMQAKKVPAFNRLIAELRA